MCRKTKSIPALLALLGAIGPGISVAQESLQIHNYFSDSDQDRNPVVTAFPQYPSIARRDRMEGEATVCFTINAKGQVIRPSIRSSSHKIFERAAMEAIRASAFGPLKPGELKSVMKTCRIFRFRLDPVVASNNES